MKIIPHGKSLKFYATMSWIVPGTIAVIACCFVLALTTVLEFRNEQKRIQSRLEDQAEVVARRISAELLIGQRGAPNSVLQSLRKDFDLDSLNIIENEPKCLSSTVLDFCSVRTQTEVFSYKRIPIISEPLFIEASVKSPSVWGFTRGKYFLWAILPLVMMLAIGLAFQRFILFKYLLRPINALVDTSIGSKEPKNYWPSEISEIANQLTKSFEGRDKEVFSQIAHGVIHDLKTLLHSPLTAVALVAEHPNGGDKRLKRLEQLNSICSDQLPKMKDIIDHTLDGVREIPLNKQHESLIPVIEGAAHTLDGLLKQTNTQLKLQTKDLVVAHDHVQLERAVTNLLKNAIEACQESKPPQNTISISIDQRDAYVDLDIEDSGTGIPSVSGKMFRPLRSTKTHGSGLGLTVTKKIVESHGGHLIPGRSKELGGAKFTIRLPLEETL